MKIKEQYVDYIKGVEYFEYTFKIVTNLDIKVTPEMYQEIIEIIEDKLLNKIK